MSDMNYQPLPIDTYALRPNQSRAKNAILMLKIMLGLEVASLISNYLQYNLLYSYQITEELADANDIRQQILGVLYLGCFILSAVTFIKWFRRAYYNLGQMDEYLSYQQKDTGIVWFIPVLNLYRPYQIMKEMYRKTKELLDDHMLPSDSLSRTLVLNTWWTLWIVNSILGNISLRWSSKADTIEEFQSLTELDLVSNLIGIPLALLAIGVVHNYAQVEPHLEEVPVPQLIPTANQINEGDRDNI